jgi:intracellular sulfur oxidation DsrE/DsrF family protein
MAAVALLCLLLGSGGGWLARDRQTVQGVSVPIAGLPDGYRAVSLAERVDPDRIVLHLDSGEPARLAASLAVAARLLDERGEQARVEVVVNSYGLDLLSRDGRYREAVERLARRHANLALVACGQTIARLRRDGVKVALIPEAAVASSAIHQITTRMAQGWVYVKV